MRIKHSPITPTRQRILLALLGLVVLGGGAYLWGEPALLRSYGLIESGAETSPAVQAPELPRIVLDLSHRALQQLRFERERSLREQRMIDFGFVKGRLRVGRGEPVRMRIRLKGDRLVHLEDPERWSFRVRTRGGGTVLGLRSFSLHLPRTRNYGYEWVFHRALSREGLIALDYRFVRLHLNGRPLGVYALEEHFDRHLIERHRLPEGPIVRFLEEAAPDLSRTVAAPSREEDWQEGPRRELAARASALLESFRRGELPVSSAFDLDAMARFFAVADVLGTRHAVVWKSVRFYYNPLTGKLVPVGFDGHHGEPDRTPLLSAELGLLPAGHSNWLHSGYGSWFRLFFNHPRHFDRGFFARYVSELERLCQPSWLDALERDLGPGLTGLYAAMAEDGPLEHDKVFSFGPELHRFRWDVFRTRCRAIEERLTPRGQVHAFLERMEPGGAVLRLGNAGSLPVEVLGLSRCSCLPAGVEPSPGTSPTTAPSPCRRRRRRGRAAPRPAPTTPCATGWSAAIGRCRRSCCRFAGSARAPSPAICCAPATPASPVKPARRMEAVCYPEG